MGRKLGASKLLFLFTAILALMSTITILGGCGDKKESVVVYTSVDQVIAEPVLEQFREKTGIEVKAVYDVEATKTVGLTNRLVAEKEKPQADVFWNNEMVQTIDLQNKGILQPYRSSQAEGLPPSFREKDDYWTGFGGRARVIIVNKDLMKREEYPSSFEDFLIERYQPGKIGMANPVFGTTATHAAAIYAMKGAEAGKDFYIKLKNRGIQIVDGNSVVKDLVADGKLAMGITDTDDALEAIKKGKPVEVIIPEQGNGQSGALVIPNSVMLIRNAPHAEQGKKLIDYLLSKEVEEALMEAGWVDIPSRATDWKTPITGGIALKVSSVSFSEIYEKLNASKKDMQELFIK